MGIPTSRELHAHHPLTVSPGWAWALPVRRRLGLASRIAPLRSSCVHPQCAIHSLEHDWDHERSRRVPPVAPLGNSWPTPHTHLALGHWPRRTLRRDCAQWASPSRTPRAARCRHLVTHVLAKGTMEETAGTLHARLRLGLGLASVQLIPNYEASQQAYRQASPKTWSYLLNPKNLFQLESRNVRAFATVVDPNILGFNSDFRGPANYLEGNLYVVLSLYSSVYSRSLCGAGVCGVSPQAWSYLSVCSSPFQH